MNNSLTYNDSFINTNPANDDIIHLMLKAVEVRVNELKENINVSKVTLPLGVHTDLTNQIKKVVENPLVHLLNMKKDLNSTISSLIIELVKQFINGHSDKVSKVFITDAQNNNNELHFSIVLKQDTYENRSDIFSILNDYKYSSLWEAYPIYFQFVPNSLSSKIAGSEIISF